MQHMAAQIIRIVMRRNRDGWFVATSEDLPGLFVAHPDIAEVVADVPVTIKSLYEAQHGVEVQVVEASYPSESGDTLPWITIPAALAAKELAQA